MNPKGHTIQSLIDHHADNIPRQNYVVYPETGKSFSWSEFKQRVQSVTCYLCEKGLSRNVPVAGLLGNGQTALELFLGGLVLSKTPPKGVLMHHRCQPYQHRPLT